MTHEKIVSVYDRVYSVMVDAKVATPLDESEYYFITRARSRAKIEEEAAGHHIKNGLIRPQYVMFGYEKGTDTNHMDDGNNGGQR